jgi:hypothetical protein
LPYGGRPSYDGEVLTVLWQVKHQLFGLIRCDLEHLSTGECQIVLRRDTEASAIFAEVFATRSIAIRGSLDLHAAFNDKGWQDVPTLAGAQDR